MRMRAPLLLLFFVAHVVVGQDYLQKLEAASKEAWSYGPAKFLEWGSPFSKRKEARPTTRGVSTLSHPPHPPSSPPFPTSDVPPEPHVGVFGFGHHRDRHCMLPHSFDHPDKHRRACRLCRGAWSFSDGELRRLFRAWNRDQAVDGRWSYVGCLGVGGGSQLPRGQCWQLDSSRVSRHAQRRREPGRFV